jgi:MmgE/PrpD N-terminal domain
MEGNMAATDITARLAKYMVEARKRRLDAGVAQAARHRILDSLAAMVSGAHMKPGKMAIRFARAQGGTAEAGVVTTGIRTTAINAALVNAKARLLMAPVLGAKNAEAVIERVNALERLKDVRELRLFLAGEPSAVTGSRKKAAKKKVVKIKAAKKK